MKKRVPSEFIVEEMRLEDIDQASKKRQALWFDTYINEEHGVTRKWIEDRHREYQNKQSAEERRQRFINGKAQGNFNAWVARDKSGEIIGSTTPFCDEDGKWHLGSLYVDKKWHGTGVAHELMKKALDWIGDDKDIYLDVVSYNERAKHFYQKWNFVQIPGSESLYADKMPEVTMIRKRIR